MPTASEWTSVWLIGIAGASLPYAGKGRAPEENTLVGYVEQLNPGKGNPRRAAPGKGVHSAQHVAAEAPIGGGGKKVHWCHMMTQF